MQVSVDVVLHETQVKPFLPQRLTVALVMQVGTPPIVVQQPFG
jgi:hypothetical protein